MEKHNRDKIKEGNGEESGIDKVILCRNIIPERVVIFLIGIKKEKKVQKGKVGHFEVIDVDEDVDNM